MKKITKINICNYRAFYNDEKEDKKEYTIALPQGENLLIYGENGSGKSSFFKALDDFFKSAEDSTMSIEENIHIEGNPDAPDAKIEVFFSEKVNNRWEALHKETIDGKEEAKGIVFAKNASTTNEGGFVADSSNAFLGYRDMLKTYFLAIDDQTQNPNLFDLVFNQLLAKITDISNNQQIKDDLDTIEKNTANYKDYIKESFAELMSDGSRAADEVGEEIFDTYNSSIFSFNQSITAILGEIVETVNGYLENDFKTNFKIDIQNKDAYLTVDYQEPIMHLSKELYLDIEYFGKKLEGKSYQSFLNEARLSALAICIYLAALKKDRPTDDNYKILFLDDIFIGLDMSNRLPLIEILNRDFTDYQIFMTTYDRAWFEVAKQHFQPKSKWKSIEIYTLFDKTLSIEMPLIIDPSLDYLAKAELYFKQKDYPTCANFQRKWCEQFLKNYLQENYRLEIGANETAMSVTKLSTLFGKLKAFFNDCGKTLPKTISDEFDKHSQTVMNPFSHDDLESPTYRSELERGFTLIEAFEKLEKLTKKPIAFKDNLIYMKVAASDYILACTLNTDLIVVKYGEESNYLDFKVDVRGYRKATPEWTIVNNMKDKTLKEVATGVFKFLNITLPEGYNELTDFKLINGENLNLEDLKAKISADM